MPVVVTLNAQKRASFIPGRPETVKHYWAVEVVVPRLMRSGPHLIPRYREVWREERPR